MKRKNLLLILVATLVLSAFFVACKADIEAPSGELVDVTFAMDGSRALSATLEDFDPGLYYWKYAAAKNAADTSGLNSGATEGYNDEDPDAREAGALWIHEGEPGLSGTVPGFSQGLWDFTLYAYTKEGTAESPVYSLTYLGEAKAVSLVKSGVNKVHVVVSPAPEGNGKLYIGETTLNPKKPGDIPSVSRFLKVEDFDEHEYAPTSGTTYILPAGTYRVTVTYKASGITYADGMVIATVYPNMTTTVTGSVDELVTYAQFEAERNPDIIFRTAEKTGIKKTDSVTEYDLVDTSTETAKVSATIPATAAKALIESTDPSATMSLALNVDTVDSTSTSVTYEIGMTKTITVDGSMPETSDVTELNDYVIATVELSAGLSGVKVTHDQNDMTSGEQWAQITETVLNPENFCKFAGTEENPDPDGYYYYYEYQEENVDKATLYIKTMTFSPFEVTYDGETAGVAEVNGVKYATLKAAVEAAQAGDTVKLLSDAEGAGMSISKSITIDLNGKTYTGTKEPAGSTGTKSQLFQLLQESGSVTIKNGALSSAAGSGILMLVQNYCNLTLEDVTLDGSNIGEGQYTLSNNQGDISIKGEKTNIVAPKDGIAFDVCSGWSVYKSTKVTVSGGNINGAIEVTDCGSADKVELVIEGGFFAKAIERPEGYQTDKVSISISGGTFVWNPWKYVADGYEAIYNPSTGLWIVSEIPGDGVAKIGTVYYNSLQAAIDDAKSGNTVELLRNVTISGVGGSDGSKQFGVYINESIKLDGCSHKIETSKTGLRALVGIKGNTSGIDVSLDNISIISGSGCSKAIETRGDIRSIAISNSVLDSSNYVFGGSDYYVQALTIGGYNTEGGSVIKTDVSISNSTLKTSEDGSVYYAVLLWNPVEMNVTDSDIRGWANFYFKDGSAGSSVTVNGSSLISKGNDGNSNTFGLITFEDVCNEVFITDSDITVSSNATKSQQALVMFSEWYGPNTGNAVAVSKGSIVMNGESAVDYIENGYENSLVIKNAKGHEDVDYHSEKVEVAFMYLYNGKEMCAGGLLFDDVFNYVINDSQWMILVDSVVVSEDKELYVHDGAKIGLICGDKVISGEYKMIITPYAEDEDGCIVASDKDISDFLDVPSGYSLNSVADIPSFTQGFNYAWRVSKN